MADAAGTNRDTRWRRRRAEALRQRLLRRWLSRALGRIYLGGMAFGRMAWRQIVTALASRRAEAEMHAMDDRELHDLGLSRGSVVYAARHGREGGE